MDNQESQLTSVKSNDFLNAKSPFRVWALSYPDRQIFYLTDEEREDFLKKVASGNTVIQLGSLTLSTRFSYLYQFKNKPTGKHYEIIDGVAKEV